MFNHLKPILVATFGIILSLLSTHEAPASDQEASAMVTEGTPERFSLVSSGDEILRVDRQNGTVSICRQRNGNWRCNPVPLAEEAYLAEINDLAAEIDRLKEKLAKLGAGDESAVKPAPDGTAATEPDEQASEEKQSSELTDADEEELDKVLDFTETAMRRFFGMVRELQKNMEESDSE